MCLLRERTEVSDAKVTGSEILGYGTLARTGERLQILFAKLVTLKTRGTYESRSGDSLWLAQGVDVTWVRKQLRACNEHQASGKEQVTEQQMKQN